MSDFGLSAVGNSTSFTIVYSTSPGSASRPSDSPVPPSSTSTCFTLCSLSPSTSNPATAITAFSSPPTTSGSSQTTTSSASSSSTSSVGHVDSSYTSSSVTPTNNATIPFIIVTKGLPPAEPTSTKVSTPTSPPVSSTVSGSTTGAESVSTSAYNATRPPDPSQQMVPASTPNNTQPGSNLLTMTTSGSIIPITTSRSTGSPHGSSTSNSLLPSTLGPVLGVLVIVALGLAVFRCRARRRSKNISTVLSSGSETSQEQKGMIIEETRRVNAVTLGRRITSYRGSSTYAPEHIITRLSHAGKSFQNSNGQFSDPFEDSSEIVPSRTGPYPASVHSVDSASTNLLFTVPVDAVARGVAEFGSPIDASSSSLGLHFVAPLTTDDSSVHLPHLSPSWHYECQSPIPSPRERKHWNEERQGKTSPVSFQAPAPPKPFPLGMGSARLRLHALLEEARKI